MESVGSNPTGRKTQNWILGVIFCLSILNFSFDFLFEYQVIEYKEGLIYGILTGMLLIGLYSIRFLKKDIIRPFDYLKLVSVLLIAGYPFIYLYAGKPWDNAVRVISLYFPFAVYIYSRFILNPQATTRQKVFVTFVKTVLIGFFLMYSQVLMEISRETERKRMMERQERLIEKEKINQLLNETTQEVIELKEKLENCK